MSRGRKALQPAEKKGPEFIGATLPDQALVEAETTKRVTALAKQLNYAGALTPDAFEDNIRRGKRRTIEGTLEMGTNLLLLKESAGHGYFLERLQAVGVAPRAAQKFMAAAMKFSKCAVSAHLIAAAGTETKLLELLVLDDEEIAALESDGSIGDITLDKIDCMTPSELRKALRESHAREEDHEGRIKALTDKNEATEQEVVAAKRQWRAGKPDDHHAALRKAVDDAANRVRDVLGYMVADPEVGLRGALARLFQFAQDQGIDESDFAADTLANLLNAVRWVRDHEEWPQAVPIRNDVGAES